MEILYIFFIKITLFFLVVLCRLVNTGFLHGITYPNLMQFFPTTILYLRATSLQFLKDMELDQFLVDMYRDI